MKANATKTRKKHAERWTALRDTTEIMRTKQLFVCRPVSVVRRSRFFAVVVSASWSGGIWMYVRLQIVLSHRCQVKRIIHWLCERHKSNSSLLVSSHSILLLVFFMRGSCIATREKCGHLALTRTHWAVFGGYITGHQCHIRIQDSSATEQLFIVFWAPPYARDAPVMNWMFFTFVCSSVMWKGENLLDFELKD